MKYTKLKAYVIVFGVPKKCRKPKKTSVQIGYFDNVDVNSSEFLAIVNNTIKENINKVTSATLYVQPVELEECDGYTMENAYLYDKRTIRKELNYEK